MRNDRFSKSTRPLLSVEETAILLGETRSTLYRALKAGTLPLPVFRIGSRIRIPRRAVERLIEGLDPEQPSPPQLSA
jgi:excisionase family DNA binding protein